MVQTAIKPTQRNRMMEDSWVEVRFSAFIRMGITCSSIQEAIIMP